MTDIKPASIPRWSVLILAAVLLFNVWLRGHTFGPTLRDQFGLDLWPVSGAEAEPLDCDEAAYAYIGRRIDQGAVMYRDLSENKPPGGYWLYALALAIGGSHELTVRVMPIPIVLATIMLVWWLGLRLRGPGAASLAALIYAVVSTDPYLYGNGANFEHAINLFAIASVACLVAAMDRGCRRLVFVSGLSLGIACLFKQVVILHGLVLALFVLVQARPLRHRVKDVLALAGGFLFVWGAAALILVFQGASTAAYEDIFQYGRALATDTPAEPNSPPFWMRWVTGNADPSGHLPPPFGKTDYLVWWGAGSWPLWLAGIPSIVALGMARTSTMARRLVAAWTVSAWIQVALPGLFWQHYYLLPLPGLAIVVAVHLADSLSRMLAGGGRAILWAAWVLVLSLALVWTGRIQVRDYLMTPPEMLTVKFKGGGQWVVLRDLGRDLAERSTLWTDPQLFIWGWQSPLFFYSGLDGVSRHFFVDNLLKAYATTDHPLIRPRIDRIMRDLNAHPPALIFVGYPPFPELQAFLREHYLRSHLVGNDQQGYPLWVERKKYREFETFQSPVTPRR
ncbi:glycosyltransferase family 39 protein [Singulisphaera sp. Ch08]|uniref:Glycosyltransferase family 39 protein n=1 Tax=Singulisphaera sp. Ch08 TaxID=3120278 RepID=A0AAU7CFD2_9BACT